MVSSSLAAKHDPEERKVVGRMPVRSKRPAVAVLLLLTGMLAACSTAQPTSTGKSNTPTTLPAGATSTPLASSTTTPSASPTPLSGAFQAVFSDHYTAAPCAGGQPTGTICVTTSGTGSVTGIGTVTLARTSIDAPPGADSCGPATTKGTLTLPMGDTITFTGTGTFCRATQVATFTYKFTGGTASYLHATGSGSIQVPLPTSSSTGTESWTGTLKP
jgi:hypothetical protein